MNAVVMTKTRRSRCGRYSW